MRAILLCAALFCLLAPGMACHRGQVKLLVSPDDDHYTWREPIDPAEFSSPCRNLRYVVAPPVGYAEAREEPLEGFTLNAQMRWNYAVDRLCACFDELAQEHNQAALAVTQFAERQTSLNNAVSSLTELRKELDVALAVYGPAKAAAAATATKLGPAAAEESSAARARLKTSQAAAESALAKAESLVQCLRPPKG